MPVLSPGIRGVTLRMRVPLGMCRRWSGGSRGRLPGLSRQCPGPSATLPSSLGSAGKEQQAFAPTGLQREAGLRLLPGPPLWGSSPTCPAVLPPPWPQPLLAPVQQNSARERKRVSAQNRL